MPRPKKRRRVCCLPSSCSFGPLDLKTEGKEQILMTLDEFETIRLIDLEGLNQEECAEKIDVARTTVQSIYNSARKKLAECLVKGKELTISGGDYILYCGEKCGCGCRHCHRRKCYSGDEFNE
ncbi:DUF134 domain-containing protein [Anaeropeptidivorans aminofermentans]|uniref:DUF134 domain-containing protein n=1 Tax=Anaeropeptidivorans aminofermentans TaxID=2934315 RepID=UPI0020247BDD|nr:DUF134 domain-containing protein [Anaeropeptidivorans aminofermentans]MBE6013713.1 DUF134 domain-containing protein [Lachnospiraceae bacterium]